MTGATAPRRAAPPLLELAVDSVADAIAALDAGADRIELCARLDLDGITPPLGLLKAIRAARPHASIAAMLCPVAREYRFTPAQIAPMQEAARDLLAAGADAVVFGAIDERARTIDAAACAPLVEAIRGAGGTPVFHRVFDTLPDPLAQLDRLIDLGFTRLLTSGGRGWINATTEQGMQGLAELVAHAGERIHILAGGGVRSTNVAELTRRTSVREVHSSARTTPGAMNPQEVAALKAALRDPQAPLPFTPHAPATNPERQ